MLKNDILALIDAKIAGQGSAIDIGGALPVILSALAGAAAQIEVDDITELTAEQLDALNVGDKVVKVTESEKHLYWVTYKATTGGGIVLTYNACGYGESIAYNRTESGWEFDSKEVKTYGD